MIFCRVTDLHAGRIANLFHAHAVNYQNVLQRLVKLAEGVTPDFMVDDTVLYRFAKILKARN